MKLLSTEEPRKMQGNLPGNVQTCLGSLKRYGRLFGLGVAGDLASAFLPCHILGWRPLFRYWGLVPQGSGP